MLELCTESFKTDGSMMDWSEVGILGAMLSGPRRLSAVTISLEKGMPEEAPINNGGALDPEAVVEFCTVSMKESDLLTKLVSEVSEPTDPVRERI
ncbi:hypothetical protein OGAPHI_003078 [Ogataea philodendri]|uniref:Uncharacterized protein n=1 Tax=Ogataea philodendri TaxID=1378263 RepID=A0A9P8T6I4_9ASCO|nr:uncharacterized protein OGAPHI_003078 [Ogataea philodendri]KAH3667429.1 hypothetical protein OGAPHI_003078 [Ogataea philodendri]